MYLLLVAMSAAAPKESSAGVHDARLAVLLDESWDATMARSPVWATQLGDHRFDDRLDDNSPRARELWRRAREGWLERARRLPALDADDALTRDVFVRLLDDDLRAEAACRTAEWSLSARGNALTFAIDVGRERELHDRAEVEAFAARYDALPAWVLGETAALRGGLRDGLVASRESVERTLELVDKELAAPAADAALLGILRAPHPKLTAGDVSLLERRVGATARGPLRSALVEYRDFLRDELLPEARPEGREGVVWLPGGEACYAARIRQETSTDRSADSIHQAGLDELARIHTDMVELGRKVLGTRDLPELLRRLREDESLHFQRREDVEATAAAALARAQAAVPKVFGRLPKADCVVKAIPDHEAPYTYIGYYWPAAPDGSNPGVYYVNSWEPTTRTRFDAEVLAWHEAVPGHHLQIALANELGALPLFRRNASFTVFVEGWALYAERLADELGLYSDDLQRLGMLGFDAWRASRLVVDTGLHAQGWTRAEAEAFLLENTPLAKNNVVNEVDRYITWPGQALGYKLGQMELLRIRREAEVSLGPRFDLRRFHDVLLGGGALPIDRVEARVQAWVKAGG